MKKVNTPRDIFKFKGTVMQTTGYSDGRVVYFQELGAKRCELCHQVKEYALVENSPNFQENAQPIETISI